MTTERMDRLPDLLTELAAPRVPAYFDDILARTAGQRQRPARTILERILPMAETTLPGARVSTPLRTFAIAILLMLLVAAIGIAGLIASRPSGPLPAPYGPAANGRIVFSSGGDIVVGDPTTGETATIVSGPEQDRNPVFSRDGTKVAFYRQRERLTEFDVMVADADGGNLHVVTTDPISSLDAIEWAPDGRTLYLLLPEIGLARIDAGTAAPPRIVAKEAGAPTYPAAWGSRAVRPPDGAQILYGTQDADGAAIHIVNADGTDARVLFHKAPASENELQEYRWSPDGTMIAFRQELPNPDDGQRIFVMEADGSNVRQLTDEPGVWFEVDLAWSPDSKRIAFNRWFQGADGIVTVRPIGVAVVDGDGDVIDAGLAPVSEGASFEWSPDGSTIVSLPGPVVEGTPNGRTVEATVIDVASGSVRQLDWSVQSATNWQRVAPLP